MTYVASAVSRPALPDISGRSRLADTCGAIGKVASAGLLVVAISAAGFHPRPAQSFDIESGNSDVTARWDNNLRYTLGERVQPSSSRILNATNYNDGDANFKSGLVTDRLDVLSEADIVYRKLLGARVSADLWYDQAYASLSAQPTYWPNQVAGNGTLTPGLGNYARRFYRGPSGELLDAFVFVNPDVGAMSSSLKVGRHTVIWGESLYLGGAVNGISYAQSPIDVAKAFANPGAEAKELFRPVNNVSLDVQASDTLALSAQYFLQWEPYRFPEGGTYFGMYDPAQFSGRVLYVQEAGSTNPLFNPYTLEHGDMRPHQLGAWGLAARWSPQALDGTVGLYYRQFSDMVPQVGLTPSLAGANFLLTHQPGPGYPNLGNYDLTYASDVHLYGVSLSKDVGGVSLGSEVNYRTNMPLVGDPATVVLTGPFAPYAPYVPGAVSTAPTPGQTVGARGDTLHAVVNLLGSMPGNDIFDTAIWSGEVAASRLQAVTRNKDAYLGRSWNIGPFDLFRASKEAATLALTFTPTWFRALPSIDLSAPLSVNWGIYGNSPVALGGNKNVGTFSFGLSALVDQKYTATLQYTGEYGQLREGAMGLVPNGLGSLLLDRGALFLTLKATF